MLEIELRTLSLPGRLCAAELYPSCTPGHSYLSLINSSKYIGKSLAYAQCRNSVPQAGNSEGEILYHSVGWFPETGVTVRGPHLDPVTLQEVPDVLHSHSPLPAPSPPHSRMCPPILEVMERQGREQGSLSSRTRFPPSIR